MNINEIIRIFRKMNVFNEKSVNLLIMKIKNKNVIQLLALLKKFEIY